MKISQEGIALIKKFEGCKLESYLCAANVPTIGYGSTKDVKMGMTISQEQAEELLIEDLTNSISKFSNAFFNDSNFLIKSGWKLELLR